MRVPLKWLKEYIKFDLTPKELGEKLTMTGLEVSAIEETSEDTVLEIDVLPNRPDCLSIIGVAREVSAITGNPLKYPSFKLKEKGDPDKKATVKVESPMLCPRYTARTIEGVKVGPSPQWLQEKIAAAGIRPINNIVDVTNFVLLELGQPMHAFDLDLLSEQKIIVRSAKKGEKIATLDGEEKTLSRENLVIADKEKPIALAGIIGGTNSEVREETSNILLESAYFDPQTTHKSSRQLKIKTESSNRFEEGVNWDYVTLALDRGAQLIAELTGGRIPKRKIDIKERSRQPKTIILRPERVNKILGTNISPPKIIQFLKRLGLKVTKRKDEKMRIDVPLFRAQDLEREIDLIEEIARLFGYDKIEASLPHGRITDISVDKEDFVSQEIRELLAGLGLFETNTSSLISPKAFDKTLVPKDSPLRDYIKIANPLSEEESILRTMMTPSLLHVLAHNFAHKVEDIGVFEIGKVFAPRQKEMLPNEKIILAGAVTGKVSQDWEEKPAKTDFYYLKGIAETLLDHLGISDYQITVGQNFLLHPGQAAKIEVQGIQLGFLGQLNPQIQKNYDLENNVFIFELDLNAILNLSAKKIKYQALPRFPAVSRDISLLVPEKVTHQEIIDLVKKTGAELLEKVSLFDRYSGSQVAPGCSAFAYNLTYRHPERTLTDKEINQKQNQITKALEDKLKIKLRV